ncbi:hypothetical protein B0H16DRAFT_1809135 [Mycena metata]|uniref:Uncharacterized protein n=1 Tax=Mycena metata TaxID=1033252 RepID=A0AAD7H719_9AGAR|nr:hypothetical protein B0H16DRAFT_1809135 [Mycena metata]
MESSKSESYDLLVVTDATASMGGYLDALRSSIPEILALAKLSGAFSRLGVLAYKDYTDAPEEIAAWSGWNSPTLPQFMKDLEPTGGGDFPEAAKTALIRGLQAVDKESRTLVPWYADAPPHHSSVQSHENDVTEAKAFPAGAVDWVTLCHTARRRNCTVFTFTPNSMDLAHSAISSKAGAKSSTLISRLTLGVILQWMGQGTSDMEDVLRDSAAVLLRYAQSPLTAKPKLTDEDGGSTGYLPPALRSGSSRVPLLPILSTALDTAKIPAAALASHSFNLAKRFGDASETDYRDLVYDCLTDIIHSNVACLTYNPIFGQLWRAVCKDTSPRKTELVNLFSEFVSKVKEAEKKAVLRQWLEESFDQTDMIEALIARHCPNADGPMVYLDLDADVQLTRTELLEVSRSCYSGVLKRIATVFTHLKVVEPDITLAPQQRSIPLALPARELFRILPHLIVPGTLYPPRAATLTAVVALITGVPFLHESATALLATAKGKWLDMEIPENISFDCARFLLSAPEGVVLTTREKRVYGAMRRYKLIELNLEAPLVVNIPWTAQKTRGPGDVKVQCKKCLVRRSITIMSHRQADRCGLCITKALSPAAVAARFPEIAEEDSCWVECSRKTCRAQYVVEDVPALKACSTAVSDCNTGLIALRYGPAAIIVATTSLALGSSARGAQTVSSSRVHFERGKSIIAESTARAVISQNGVEWLGYANKEIFDGKSAFKLMQAFGEGVFAETLSTKSLNLVLNHKKIWDVGAVIAQVENRVGRGEVVLATCALCFEDIPKTKLVVACGRTGCSQLVVKVAFANGCYGQNAPGKLLNMMQFTCPFCRRKPTVKTLVRYNRAAIGLGGLQGAMDDRRFFYAWCGSCGYAKRAHERNACTEERIPQVSDFCCQDCRPRQIEQPVNEFSKENERWRRDKLARSAEWKDPGFRVVVCPNPLCQSKRSRIDGCNNMLCVCGTYFCYGCEREIISDGMGGHASCYNGAYD